MATWAGVVAVGTELTTGQTVDTNSAYIAQRLAEVGVVCRAHETAEDSRQRIASAIARLARDSDVVVVSGGLGPTADDVTREALADALGVGLELHEESLRRIEGFFQRIGRPMNETNRVQAMCPIGAEVLPNPVGSAPGLMARLHGAVVFVVPGVPREMRRMMVDQVIPRLHELDIDGRLCFRTVHTFGAGESDIAAQLADLMDRDANPLVGTTVAGGVVSVRIAARAGSAEAAVRRADETTAIVRERLGGLVFGVDDDSLASVVVKALIDAESTLATAESCTGGLLGKMITDVAGASEVYPGGFVCYANRAKVDLLGVPVQALESHGAVSEPVALAMARGAAARMNSEYALAITGIAGPGGGTAEKPVGLVYVALYGPGGAEARRLILPGDRDLVRLRAALTALDMLRRALAR